jgi:hypothetical protein
MNYLNELIGLPQQEFRNFVKTNSSNSDFISEVVSEKQTYLPLLLKNKFVPQSIEDEILKLKDGALFLLEKYIEYSYIPGPNFFDSVVMLSDEESLKFFKSFPSYPVQISNLIKLLNNEKTNTVLHLVSQRKDLQKEEIIFILIKSGIKDPLVSKLAAESKLILAKVADAIESRVENNYLYNPIYNRSSKSKSKSEISIDDLCPDVLGAAINFSDSISIRSISGLKISEKHMSSFLEKEIQKKKKQEEELGTSYVYRTFRQSEYIEWVPALEQIELDLIKEMDLNVKNPPENSKFRNDWIFKNPSDATDVELIEKKDILERALFTSTASRHERNRSNLPKILLLKGQKFVDHYGAKAVLEYATKDCIDNALIVLLSDSKNLDYVLHLLEHAPARLKNAFRKKIPIENIPEKFNARKRSFFDEAHSSLVRGDIDEFRSVLSGKYDLSKFIKDSHQTSKSAKVSSSFLSCNIFEKLSVEEILCLINTSYRFSLYGYGESELSERFDEKQAFDLLSKLPVSVTFTVCKEKKKYLNVLSIDSLFDLINADDCVIKTPEYLKIILKRLKGKNSLKSELSNEKIKELCNYMTKEEIEGVVVPIVSYWDIAELCATKCADGSWLIEKEAITKNAVSILETSIGKDNLIKRDPEFASKLFDAFLKGNSELSSFLGYKVNIRRRKSDVSSAKTKLISISSTEEEFIERLSNPVEAMTTYSDFIERFNNLKEKPKVL